MKLNWYKVGQDLSASFKDTVFRLHKVNEEKKFNYYGATEKGYFEFYQLEARKERLISFTNLKYFFYTDYPIDGKYIVQLHSVDNKDWNSINDIIERTEEILLALKYIPSSSSANLPEEYITFQSNYFRASDEDKLDEIIEKIESYTKQEIGYWVRGKDSYLIYCRNGSILNFFEENDDTLEVFQSILPKNEVAVFKEIYAGKLDERENQYDYHLDIKLLFVTRSSFEIHDIEEEIVNKTESILLSQLTMPRNSMPYQEDPLSSYQNPYYFPFTQNKEPKKPEPVTGHIYIVKSTDLNLYGFRMSKDDIHPDIHIQLRFSRQKYPIEVISYFESNNVNKMFRVVKKCFEEKKTEIDYRKWGELAQNNWYDLSEEDITKIKDDNFSVLMQEILQEGELKKNEFLTPGGYVILFRDKFTSNAYHLRTTTKADHRNLIWRGNNESIQPVIGFLTKNVEEMRSYFHNVFRNKRDFSENANKEKYLFDENDILTIQSLSQNEKLQIVEVITNF